MAKFSPDMLVPALPTEKAATARTAKDVALANINRMKEQFAAGDGAEGRKNFKPIAGNRMEFTIRVSNTPLILERTKVQDTEVEVSAMTVPTVNFNDALDYYADRIKAGEYDPQLATLTDKKAARTEKLKTTRAARKVETKSA